MNENKRTIIVGFGENDQRLGNIERCILEKLFPEMGVVWHNITSARRLDTNDRCMETFVQDIKKTGFGIKAHTSSDNLSQHGLSAGMYLRQNLDPFCIYTEAFNIRSMPLNTVKILQYCEGAFGTQVSFEENETLEQDDENFYAKTISTEVVSLIHLQNFIETAKKLSSTENLRITLLSSGKRGKEEEFFFKHLREKLENQDVMYEQCYGLHEALTRKDRIFLTNFSVGETATAMLPYNYFVPGALLIAPHNVICFDEAPRTELHGVSSSCEMFYSPGKLIPFIYGAYIINAANCKTIDDLFIKTRDEFFYHVCCTMQNNKRSYLDENNDFLKTLLCSIDKISS